MSHARPPSLLRAALGFRRRLGVRLPRENGCGTGSRIRPCRMVRPVLPGESGLGIMRGMTEPTSPKPTPKPYWTRYRWRALVAFAALLALWVYFWNRPTLRAHRGYLTCH